MRALHISRAAGFLAVLAAMVVVGASGCGPSKAPTPAAKESKLTVAAAASLRFALPEIIAAFEKEKKGTKVEAIYGSSGSLSQQIAAHAPFDVFLSADENYAVELVRQRHGVGGSILRYATGRLALWVPRDSPLDISKGMEVLSDPSVKKIAIANPKLAPYGVAAEESLKSAGIYEAVKDRLALGENIAQTAQFVESGAAQAGLIALSLVVAPEMKDKGHSWTVPESSHTPIVQSGCISAYSKDQRLAEAFMAFLQSDPAREVLRRDGFGIPGE
jgi:molybdate transport system substrate-binding protein